jgi:tRNA modification GTPase
MFDIRSKNNRLLFIANKMDLNPYTKPESYYNETINRNNLITASALNNMNIEYIKEKLFNVITEGKTNLDQTIVSNSRHYDSLLKTNEALDSVLSGLDSEITGDFIAMDLRRALHFLGEITGEISSEDLLDSIFSRFCIGK